MHKEEFKQLMEKYLQETISADEIDRLMEGLANKEDWQNWEEVTDELLNNPVYHGYSDETTRKNVFQRIVRGNDPAVREGVVVDMNPGSWRIDFRKMAAAVVVLLMLGSGTYFLFNKKATLKNTGAVAQVSSRLDIAPGSNRAILTLANGSTITLDSAMNGTLAMQGNSRVIKLDSGVLSYQKNAASAAASEDLVYNVLTTPRGGQYQLTLPDGTRIWLNAASSIRYSTVFSGRTREVDITGEAYFEIAHNAKMPFIVRANGQVVHVLGTHFNINAYADEAFVRTTLLEGAVRVINKGDSVVLAPGQQTQTGRTGGIKLIEDADTETAVAWKNGFFGFRQADIETVMRQLARWYDMDVRYEGKVNTSEIFSGEIDRNLALSDVLSGLKLTRIHYRIEEGRKLVILPK